MTTKTEAIAKFQTILTTYGFINRYDATVDPEKCWLQGGDLCYGVSRDYGNFVDINVSWGYKTEKNADGDTVHSPKITVNNSSYHGSDLDRATKNALNFKNAVLAANEIRTFIVGNVIVSPKAKVDAWEAQRAEELRIQAEAAAARELAEKLAKRAATSAKRAATRAANKEAERRLAEMAAAHEARVRAAGEAALAAANVEAANG